MHDISYLARIKRSHDVIKKWLSSYDYSNLADIKKISVDKLEEKELHGIMSCIEVVEYAGKYVDKDVLNAIALHSIKANKIVRHPELSDIQRGSKLSGLLRLCDELHEWGRPSLKVSGEYRYATWIDGISYAPSKQKLIISILGLERFQKKCQKGYIESLEKVINLSFNPELNIVIFY